MFIFHSCVRSSCITLRHRETLPVSLSGLVDNATAFKSQIPGFQVLNLEGIEGQFYVHVNLSILLDVF